MSGRQARKKRQAAREALEREVQARVLEHLWRTWNGKPVMRAMEPKR